MWETTRIENELKARLDNAGSTGQALWARYIAARTLLVDQVLPWIKINEPNLTDHGPEHIRNVLENAHTLLGENTTLNNSELYILCQSILFHDVGNLFGRKKHNQRINDVYGSIFSGLWANRQETALVVSIGRSHSGKSVDGSTDTLKDLRDAFFSGENIRVQCLAAILRFADELAEGPQRTSEYLQSLSMFTPDSQIFHEYASCTNLHIDRGGGRVALSYHIDLDTYDFKNDDSVSKFVDFLKLVYSRIHKLDSERRYCKHYSEYLEAFKKTSVVLNFWKDNQQLETSSPPPVDLDDLFIPETGSKDIEKTHPEYAILSLISRLKMQTGDHNE
jgi:hypothetical protein